MSDEERWQAILNRDPASDGKFVYAVKSTGIYCRPICASRRPKPQQISFFDQPEAAEQAGFRACRRCLPAELNPQTELIRQICAYIEQRSEETLTLDELGKEVNLSPAYLQRVFKKALGISPRQYLEAYRLDRLKKHLKEGDTISGAMYEVGYSSSSRLYERSTATLGMTPAEYRQGGKGMVIRYSVVSCSLGWMLVAATERGLCAVSLGDNEPDLVEALRLEYPHAGLNRDDASLTEWSAELVAHLNGRPLTTDLPLAVACTPFQGRVWQELQNIPSGTTRSYGEVARAIGQPTAVRAVAHACASNKVALVIPCHRVIREDGNLGGYRWGLDRKRTLLAQEQAVLF